MDALSIILQISIVLMICCSFRKKTDDTERIFIDRRGSYVWKGVCCIIISMFHTPAGSIYNNLIGSVLHPFIVSLFSFFSAYGIWRSLNEKENYLKKLGRRIIRLCAIYLMVILLKYVAFGAWNSGGIQWINVLILFYISSFATMFLVQGMSKICTFCKDTTTIGAVLVMVLWIIYSIVFQFLSNAVFGWAAQSFGFVYGVIFALYEAKLFSFFQKFRVILGACAFSGLILTGVRYIKVHNIFVVTTEAYVLRVLICLELFILLFCLSTYVDYKNSIMEFIGKVCIYIFLVHGIYIDILSGYLSDGILQCAVIVFSVGSAIIVSKIEAAATYFLKLGKELRGN